MVGGGEHTNQNILIRFAYAKCNLLSVSAIHSRKPERRRWGPAAGVETTRILSFQYEFELLRNFMLWPDFRVSPVSPFSEVMPFEQPWDCDRVSSDKTPMKVLRMPSHRSQSANAFAYFTESGIAAVKFLASSTIRNSGLYRGKRGNSSTFDGRLWRMLRGDAHAKFGSTSPVYSGASPHCFV